MKIIDLGICTDNNDPKGIGRIRYQKYLEYNAPKEQAYEYIKWDEKDLFIASPFLPLNMNFIPEIGQAIKLISYDNEQGSLNVEYIAGPFISSFNFNDQQYEAQVLNTTMSSGMKPINNISDEEKKLLPKYEDYGIFGKYGSDLLFTKNGVQLRGGKLKSKEKLKAKEVNKGLKGKTSSNLQLSKFSQKIELKKEIKEIFETEVTNLSSVIEYEIDSLSSPTEVRIYVYKIGTDYDGITKTDRFNASSELPTSIGKLITTGGTSASTYVVSIPEEKRLDYNYIGIFIKDIIKNIRNEGMSYLNKSYPKNMNIFPLYFRPSIFFNSISDGNSQTTSNKINTISEKIRFGNTVKGQIYKFGMIWSKDNTYPPVKTKKISYNIFNTEDIENSIGSLKSDIIYLLSTNTTNSNNKVPFDKISEYEITQENYAEMIHPNTYSTVRGETLLKILKSIISVLYTHQHNVIGPMVKREEHSEYKELENLIETIESDILNKNIRIN